MSEITDQNRINELIEIRRAVEDLIESGFGGQKVIIDGARDATLFCSYYPHVYDDEGCIEFLLQVERLTPNQAAVIAAREANAGESS